MQPFDLNWRHLLAVAAIAARGSMRAAAQAVSLSQPALTQGLAKLEARLATRLFVRHADGMTPTAAGRVLAERVEAASAALADAVRGPGRGFARPERLITATQLRALVALADAGSFVGAAALTGLSQPAIHRSIRELEQILATPLAERRGRGVTLTQAGRRLARGGRLATGEIAAAIAELEDDGAAAQPFAIGAMPLCRARLLPIALDRLLAEQPAATVTVVEGSWRELVEPLRDGSLAFMIGALRQDPAPADLAQAPLYEDRLVVVGGASHPLAGTGDPDRATLARYRWIVGPAGSPLRAQWEALFAGGPLPAAPIACGSVMTMRELLARGDYLTLLSPAQVAVETGAGLLATIGRPLTATSRMVGVVTRAAFRPTRAQRRFLDLLAEIARAGGHQEIE